MQSGISASAELQSAFQTLLSTPSQRGLLAKISNEQIVPSDTIPSSSSTFLSDLSNLSQHLTPNTALYILLRRADDTSSNTPQTGSLVAITYVPNAAPVRQKMLFASTRLSLLRELGSENFGESVFCTEASDLTAEGWKKHEAHGEAANPLTQEERDLEGIKEAEAMESRGTRGQAMVSGGRIAMKADDGVMEALQGLGRGRDNLVQLRIDVPTETLQLASVSSSSTASLANDIEGSEPRFSFFRHDAIPEGPVVFISTCPSGAKIKERMLYAASRNSVMAAAQSEGGLTISKKIEATNPDEVTEKAIQEEFKVEGQKETKSGFAKPKRPGRR